VRTTIKPPKGNPVEALYLAASNIVAGMRKASDQSSVDAREVRIPILMHGTDMRVTIEAGPKIAARNAIEHAQMKASGEPVVHMSRTLDEARALLSQYADEIRATETIGGEWPTSSHDEKQLHDRILTAVAGMTELERLL